MSHVRLSGRVDHAFHLPVGEGPSGSVGIENSVIVVRDGKFVRRRQVEPSGKGSSEKQGEQKARG